MITARHEYMDRPFLLSDLSCEGDKGVTKQSDLKDCNINAIFERYERTGQLPGLIVKDGRYGDFSSVPEYQEALNIVKFAEEQFDALDVTIRNRFENNPAKFLAFVSDEKNKGEMAKMGLLSKEAEQAYYDGIKAAEEAAIKAKSTVPT